MPLVTLLWANIHGGYAIAFMLMAVYLVGDTFNHLTGHRDDPLLTWSQLARLIVIAAVSFAVVAINPNGWQMWTYPFRTVGIGALRDFIQEWQSPDFHQAWQHATVIDVCMAENDRVYFLGNEAKVAVQNIRFLAQALKQAAVQQEPLAVDGEQVHGTGDRAGRAPELDLHGGLRS